MADGRPLRERAMSQFAGLTAVGSAYAAQGFGYAVVATALPAVKDRVGLSETLVSALLLGMCLAAALGSVLADWLAVHWNSGRALVIGFALEAAALVAATTLTSMAGFIVALSLYGIGLGAVDAASNMQGVLLQARSSTPVFGRLYAAYTVAAILGTLMTVAFAAFHFPGIATLAVAALVILALTAAAYRSYDQTRAAHRSDDHGKGRMPLPRRAIWIVGSFILAAFVVDSAVSIWSTLYLQDGLGAGGSTAPLGYAAYLVVVLVSRLAADPAVARYGRTRTASFAIGMAALGCVVVATIHTEVGAIIGFAAAGTTAGLLVPIAFARAGELVPTRSDEVIARVNMFNYVGAFAGAVLLGALAGNATALGYGFLIPMVILVGVIPLLRALRATPIPVHPSRV